MEISRNISYKSSLGDLTIQGTTNDSNQVNLVLRKGGNTLILNNTKELSELKEVAERMLHEVTKKEQVILKASKRVLKTPVKKQVSINKKLISLLVVRAERSIMGVGQRAYLTVKDIKEAGGDVKRVRHALYHYLPKELGKDYNKKYLTGYDEEGIYLQGIRGSV